MKVGSLKSIAHAEVVRVERPVDVGSGSRGREKSSQSHRTNVSLEVASSSATEPCGRGRRGRSHRGGSQVGSRSVGPRRGERPFEASVKG